MPANRHKYTAVQSSRSYHIIKMMKNEKPHRLGRLGRKWFAAVGFAFFPIHIRSSLKISTRTPSDKMREKKRKETTIVHKYLQFGIIAKAEMCDNLI